MMTTDANTFRRRHREFSSCVPAQGPPRAFRLAHGVHVERDQFFQRYAALFELGAHDSLHAYRQGTDISGCGYTKYVQRYRNVPVAGGEMVLAHQDAVLAGIGRVIPNLTLSVEPRLTDADAIRHAVAAIAERRRLAPENLRLTAEPTATLVIASERSDWASSSYRLAYRCLLATEFLLGALLIDVDAETGRILNYISRARTAWTPAPCKGQSLYDGEVTFMAEQDDSGADSRLRNPLTVTLDTHGDFDYDAATDFIGRNGIFTDPDLYQGVSVHWAAERVNDYFLQKFQRLGYDGEGTPLTHYVDTGLDDLAKYLIDKRVVIYGPLKSAFPPASLDLVAHEMTHGVTHTSIGIYPFDGLGKENESGALDESFGDIFATLVEFATPGTHANWVMLEDLSKWGPSRSLSDPKAHEDPDTYGGQHWEWSAGESAVHENAGVPNYCFFLLSEGGIGTNDNFDFYEVKGIGKDAAGSIAYLNLTAKLFHGALFHDAREGAIQAAIQLFGEFSQERASTEDAWYAVGVGAKYAATVYYSPAHQAVDVEPWTATLKWQQGLGEKKWEIDVSTAADFSAGVQSLVSADTTVANNIEVGVVSVALKPNTKYYWRVRKFSGEPNALGWRPPHTFETLEKKSQALAPSAERAAPYHPWHLRFEWDTVDGAEDYRLEIAADNSFAAGSLIRHHEQSLPPAFLDVRVDMPQWWRVTPIGPQGIPGAWSTAVMFDTTLPQAVLESPIDNAPTYPWPAPLVWKSVLGAAQYVLELTMDDGQFVPGKLYTQITIDAPLTHKEIDLKPEPTNKHVPYWWRVRVIGPRISEEIAGEEGAPSEDGEFFIDGDATIVHNLHPHNETISNYITTKGLVDYGQTVPFKWQGVKGALQYRISVWECLIVGDPEIVGNVKTGAALYTNAVPHVGDPLSDQYAQVDGVSKPATGVYGCLYNITALGPDGYQGLGAENRARYIVVSKPKFLKPAGTKPGDDAWSYDPAVLEWMGVYSPSGQYVIAVYRHPGTLSCGDDDLDVMSQIGFMVEWQPVPGGDPHGVSSHAVALDPDTAYRWKVRAHAEWAGDPFPYNCGEFTTKSAPKPQPPATPEVAKELGGSIGKVLLVFQKVDGADHYQFELALSDFDNPDIIIGQPQPLDLTEGEIDNFSGAIVAELQGSGNTIGPWSVITYTGVSPLHFYKWRVRACAGDVCSPFSIWAYWSEFYPWPF